MTRLPLSFVLGNSGLYRRQSLIRTVLGNSPRRSTSSKVSKADVACEEETSEPPIVRIPKKRGRKKKEKPDADVKKKKLEPGEVLPDVPAGELPPLDLWRKYFPTDSYASIQRCTIRKPETAAMLADIFVPEGSKDKIIIEANPGPGQLTRALLGLPKERVKRIYVLEPSYGFLRYLWPLEQLDSRVKVYSQHGKDWQVYTKMKNDGAFEDVAQLDWDKEHPQLHFIMHMTGWVDNEQLLSQFFRCIPDRQWLFAYGRVPMNLILPQRMWERLHSPLGTATRGKLSVIGQVTANVKECVPAEALAPYSEHFYPEPIYKSGNYGVYSKTSLEPRKLGSAQRAIRVFPKKTQHIARGDLDLWDFVLRKLFSQRATSIENSLKNSGLGPGSNNLIPKLIDPSREPDNTFDISKDPRNLSIQEWVILLEAFKKWPFKPDDLGIDVFHEHSNQNR